MARGRARDVSLDAIVERLHRGDIPATVVQTGGGVATIFAGDLDRDGEAPVLAGPGWFSPGPYSGPAYASTEEFFIGPDFDRTPAHLLGLSVADERSGRFLYQAQASDGVDSLTRKIATMVSATAPAWSRHVHPQARRELTAQDWGLMRRNPRKRYRNR